MVRCFHWRGPRSRSRIFATMAIGVEHYEPKTYHDIFGRVDVSFFNRVDESCASVPTSSFSHFPSIFRAVRSIFPVFTMASKLSSNSWTKSESIVML